MSAKSYNRSFLEDIGRVAALDYQPSDEDIVRARLRTTGVQEHRFKLDRCQSCRRSLYFG